MIRDTWARSRGVGAVKWPGLWGGAHALEPSVQPRPSSSRQLAMSAHTAAMFETGTSGPSARLDVAG
jgi:hypothetical protein